MEKFSEGLGVTPKLKDGRIKHFRIHKFPPPVIIGGVGGSGTRVVAEIVYKLGYYLGNDLNTARDNLWFLLLFKRPKWYQKARHDSKAIFIGLSLFSKAMLFRKAPTWPELKFVFRAIFEIAIFGHNYRKNGRGIWPFVRAWKMLTSQIQMNSKYTGWGWKEPNAHIYLDYLAEYFDQFKYIHMIRHGLDMAFSPNQQQLYNWGPIFKVAPPKRSFDEPQASLKYWVKANRRAFNIGRQLGEKKFLAVNYDKLCLTPDPEIQRLLNFLNLTCSRKTLSKISAIPKKPKTMCRYQEQDLGQFDPNDLADLATFGYSIPDHLA